MTEQERADCLTSAEAYFEDGCEEASWRFLLRWASGIWWLDPLNAGYERR